MKIIITSPSLDTKNNISGISSVTNFIIGANKGNEYQHFEIGKKDHEKRDLSWLVNMLKMYYRWFILLTTSKNTLIHFNCPIDKAALIRDTPLILMVRLFRKRMIIHIHGGEYLLSQKISPFVKFFLKLNFAGKIPKVVLSELEKAFFENEINCRNVYVLPNCVELTEAEKFHREILADTIPLILFLGRISFNKGIDIIFQALEDLKRTGLKFKFIVAGKGPEEALYIEKFQSLLGDDFEFKGTVFGQTKTALLKQCNVFLLPSFFEGLPMALIEAMSFGQIPVVTDVGSINYLIENNDTGIFVRKHSPNDIVDAISNLSHDKNNMKRLSKNARQTVFRKCNPASYITQLNEIYKYE